MSRSAGLGQEPLRLLQDDAAGERDLQLVVDDRLVARRLLGDQGDARHVRQGLGEVQVSPREGAGWLLNSPSVPRTFCRSRIGRAWTAANPTAWAAGTNCGQRSATAEVDHHDRCTLDSSPGTALRRAEAGTAPGPGCPPTTPPRRAAAPGAARSMPAAAMSSSRTQSVVRRASRSTMSNPSTRLFAIDTKAAETFRSRSWLMACLRRACLAAATSHRSRAPAAARRSPTPPPWPSSRARTHARAAAAAPRRPDTELSHDHAGGLVHLDAVQEDGAGRPPAPGVGRARRRRAPAGRAAAGRPARPPAAPRPGPPRPAVPG